MAIIAYCVDALCDGISLGASIYSKQESTRFTFLFSVANGGTGEGWLDDNRRAANLKDT